MPKKKDLKVEVVEPDTAIKLTDEQIKILNNPRKAYSTRYPEHIKNQAIALKTMNYSYSQIESITNVPRGTLHSWMQGDIEGRAAISEVAEQINNTLAESMTIASAMHVLNATDPDKIAKASAKDSAIVMSIMQQNYRLMKGLSTENIAHLTKRVQDNKNEKQDSEGDLAKVEAEIAMLKQRTG